LVEGVVGDGPLTTVVAGVLPVLHAERVVGARGQLEGGTGGGLLGNVVYGGRVVGRVETVAARSGR
jgi:hypothetical protein